MGEREEGEREDRERREGERKRVSESKLGSNLPLSHYGERDG